MKKRNQAMAIAAVVAMSNAVQAEPTMQIGGIIGIEVFTAEDDSDIAVATAELAIRSQLNEKVSAELVLLHEEDDTPFGVDAATITVSASDALSITAGQTVVAFGAFETHMISDTFGLELAEIPATALQFDYSVGPITVSLYTFNGANADDQIDNHGANISYSSDIFTLGAGYIDNIGDSDLIAAETIADDVAATSINIGLNLSNFTLLAEHISATDKFQVGDGTPSDPEAVNFTAQAQPSASQVELAYTMENITFAVGMQQTKEAEELGLPESRTLAAISHLLMARTAIALEYTNDENYAGESTNTITAQLSIEF